ncbi:MAG: hydrogenase iron-sulfur subunit, partial [Gammaproteobacteria bacterium]|nr:hydrogenase iron-sulfur subunit [Gammaproteobacteria bacterium]
PARKPAVVKVDLENCNGCGRCVDDCPFSAIEMAPRSDGKKYASEAVVSAGLCLSCGICVGSCPTATPFRTRSALSAGIDLPDQAVNVIRDLVTAATQGLEGSSRLLIFGCEGSHDLDTFIDRETALVSLTCMAQIPPSFVDWVLSRDLADGVILRGCAHGDCNYRLGVTWTEQRMNRERDPRLRKRVNDEKLALLWTEPWCDLPNTAAAITAFRETLTAPDKTLDREATGRVKTRRHPLRPVGVALAWGLFAVVSVIFTVWPRFSQLAEGNAIISLTFSHAGQRLEECRKRSQEELNKLPPNMRKPSDCPRERHAVRVSFSADDEMLYEQNLLPSGVWKDGESTIYNRIELPVGDYNFFVGMSDSGREEGFDYTGQTELTLTEGQHVVVEFNGLQETFVFR